MRRRRIYIFPLVCLHVESEKVALEVLKRCDVEKLYVVADADEWRDFPAAEEKIPSCNLTLKAMN